MKTILITLLFAISATLAFGQSSTTPKPKHRYNSKKQVKTVVVYTPPATYITTHHKNVSVSRPVANWKQTRAAYQAIKNR